MPCLIVIWMTVTPVPVIVLVLMFLMLVGKIILVALLLIGPVSAVLAFVPVVIVVVPRVVDPDLYVFIVGRCGGDSGGACHKAPPSRKVLLRIALLGTYIVLQTAIPEISIFRELVACRDRASVPASC